MGKIKKDSLGDRMKRYETVSKTSLVSRMPVILRLDGCHFHTFTRGFQKPFDEVLMKTMKDTMKYLCESIQGCVFGYTQSDEITLVLVDYQNINSSAWFDNEVQKMCSVASSMASMVFNKIFKENYQLAYSIDEINDKTIDFETYNSHQALRSTYERAIKNGAYFDCRAFNVPKEDVCNCVIWRQKDAERNSIQALAQANFPHKELQNLNCNQLQDKLFIEKDINWNDLSVDKKRGSACIKQKYSFTNQHGEETIRTRWIIDNNMPILTQDRQYIEKLIFVEKNN